MIYHTEAQIIILNPFHTDRCNPGQIRIANPDSTQILFRWHVWHAISRWCSGGYFSPCCLSVRSRRGKKLGDDERRYISKGCAARVFDLALAMARHLLQGMRVEWSMWIAQKCADVLAISCQTCSALRNLSAMSPYAFHLLWYWLILAIQESLALTRSISRCLYELRSCMCLGVLHQNIG